MCIKYCIRQKDIEGVTQNMNNCSIFLFISIRFSLVLKLLLQVMLCYFTSFLLRFQFARLWLNFSFHLIAYITVSLIQYIM